MDVIDHVHVDRLDLLDCKQLLGRNEDFVRAEHLLRDLRANQDTVLRRNQQILRRASLHTPSPAQPHLNLFLFPGVQVAKSPSRAVPK